KTYIVTANEGDSRDYEGFSEETRVKNLDLDPIIFPNASQLQAEQVLGRLKTTNTLGDLDNDGDVDRIYAFGGRSFSILDEDGKIVFDSGDEFAKIIAQQLPNDFNSDNDENNSFDQRSDDKGAEPEGITIGEIDGRIYAFIGLERIGGIMVYDVTNPLNPTFVIYVNNRDFTGEPELGTAGDLAPEGLLFISPTESPNHQPLLIVTNEVSGTTTLYSVGTTSQIESVPESTSLLSLLGLLAFLSRKKSS
ncbi:MAG: PEP-CTERM sorting domain-containing protein, partial [Cyanobacteria bacterium J083]